MGRQSAVPTVRLIDCKGLSYSFGAGAGEMRVPVATDYQAVETPAGKLTLFYRDGSQALVVTFPRHGNVTNENFDIKWDSPDDCTVFYKPTAATRMRAVVNPVKKKIADFFGGGTGKFIAGMLAVLLLAAAWWMITPKDSTSRRYEITLTPSGDDTIEYIGVVSASSIPVRIDNLTLTLTLPDDDRAFGFGGESIVISYGNEGVRNGYNINELLSPTVEGFFTDDSFGEFLSETVTAPPSPASVEYNRIISTGEVTTSDINGFKKQFPNSKYLSMLNEKLSAQKEAEEINNVAVKTEYKKLIARLGSMDVKKSDVIKVIEYEKEHRKELASEIEENRAKVEAYQKFFDPKASFIGLTKYFSKPQREACKYYLTIKKNDPMRDFKYAEKRSKEMGLQY